MKPSCPIAGSRDVVYAHNAWTLIPSGRRGWFEVLGKRETYLGFRPYGLPSYKPQKEGLIEVVRKRDSAFFRQLDLTSRA